MVKGRYFCTSCHTKRAVAFAEWLHTTVLLPVPHRQIVLTIPKMLCIYFRYDRRLLGDLCRVAAGVIVESFRVLLAVPQAQPGLVVCVHTYGDAAKYHPHLHVMATDGAFTPDGGFHALPTMSLAPIEELFPNRVFKMLMKMGQWERFVFSRLNFSWRGLVTCCADQFSGKCLDKPSPRPEYAATWTEMPSARLLGSMRMMGLPKEIL